MAEIEKRSLSHKFNTEFTSLESKRARVKVNPHDKFYKTEEEQRKRQEEKRKVQESQRQEYEESIQKFECTVKDAVVEAFENLKKSQMMEFAEKLEIKVNKTATKPEVIAALTAAMVEYGTTNLFNTIPKDKLQDIVKATVDLESGNHSALLKEYKTLIKDGGVRAFLQSKRATKEVLDIHLSVLSLKKTPSEDKQHKIERIIGEIFVVGFQRFFENIPVDSVRDVARIFDVKVSGTKSQVLERLVRKFSPEIIEEVEEVVTPKEPITVGMTAQHLYNTYTTDELRDYCRQEGLKVGGKNSELRKRIVEHHKKPKTEEEEGEEEAKETKQTKETKETKEIKEKVDTKKKASKKTARKAESKETSEVPETKETAEVPAGTPTKSPKSKKAKTTKKAAPEKADVENAENVPMEKENEPKVANKTEAAKDKKSKPKTAKVSPAAGSPVRKSKPTATA